MSTVLTSVDERQVGVSELQFMATGASNPAQNLQLIGVVAAARALNITPEGLRHRVRRGLGKLRPIGLLSDPSRYLFRKSDVLAEARSASPTTDSL